jgi:hypothetical protein
MTIGNSDNAYAAPRIGVLAAKEEVMSKNTEKVAFILQTFFARFIKTASPPPD